MSANPTPCPSADTPTPLPGKTGWSAIPAILALDATKRRDYTRESCCMFQTDRAGLLSTIRAGTCAQDALSDALQIFGTLFACAVHAELSPADLHAMGWIVCGIAELKSEIDGALASMNDALLHGDHFPDSQEATKGGRP